MEEQFPFDLRLEPSTADLEVGEGAGEAFPILFRIQNTIQYQVSTIYTSHQSLNVLIFMTRFLTETQMIKLRRIINLLCLDNFFNQMKEIQIAVPELEHGRRAELAGHRDGVNLFL